MGITAWCAAAWRGLLGRATRKRVPAAAIGSATKAFERGESFASRVDFDSAIAAYSEAVRLNPNYADAFHKRGYAYAELGALDLAMADWTEAIRLNPKLARAYYNRGVAYLRRGDKLKAERDFAQAKKLGYEPSQGPGRNKAKPG